MADTSPPAATFRDRLEDRLTGLFLKVLSLMPYKQRLQAAEWIFVWLVAPLAGMNRRVRSNLAYVCPSLPKSEVRAITRAAVGNPGRWFAELFSPEEFEAATRRSVAEGPGWEICAQQLAKGQAFIVVSGHFGNYEALRLKLIEKGHNMGALFRPMNNAVFSARWEEALRRAGPPMFPRGRQGFRELITHLKAGDPLAILIDQRMKGGAELTFFDKPAWTALSPAQLSLKFDIPMIPMYGIRSEDGLSFRFLAEDPIPQTDPETMMQAANDSLEAMIRAHMGQWMWSHRRWGKT